MELRIARQDVLSSAEPPRLRVILDSAELISAAAEGFAVSDTTAPGDPARDDLTGIAWHISTKSPSGGGSCVEAGPLADGSGRVAVRHSHRPDGAVIVYTPDEWRAFVAGVKDGEFDFGIC